jgi:hypothetical protein
MAREHPFRDVAGEILNRFVRSFAALRKVSYEGMPVIVPAPSLAIRRRRNF